MDMVNTETIARIKSTNGGVAGTGFLVSPQHVLTCAHVVADAMGIPRTTEPKPVGCLHIDFPHCRPVFASLATVADWYSAKESIPASESTLDDIALLELAEPLPIRPVCMSYIRDLWNREFRTYGFPRGHDSGLWAGGVLQATLPSGWLQLQEAGGAVIEAGFSGAPIWDQEGVGIVGMMVARAVGQNKRLAFAIPSYQLLRAVPTLTSCFTEEFQSYLQRLIARLSKLPPYYPPTFGFDDIRQRVHVSGERLSYSDEEIRTREMARRLGSVDSEETLQRQLERAYLRRGRETYEERASVQSTEEDTDSTLKNPGVVEWEDVRTGLDRAVILGDPGFGKTWLLNHEGRKIAREQLEALNGNGTHEREIVLPIHLRLPSLAQEMVRTGAGVTETIMALLVREFRPSQFFESWVCEHLSTPNCVLLLDGLDEITEVQRADFADKFSLFCKETHCRILITSRIVGYRSAPFPLASEGGTTELELVAFEWPQVTGFVGTWFSTDSTKRKLLETRLRVEPALRGLARIPLMLSFLCLLGADSAPVPATRSELYECMLRHLLERPWHDAPVADEGRIEDKVRVLEHVAWHFATSGARWRDLFPGTELNAIINQQPEATNLRESGTLRKSVLRELSEDDGILVKVGVQAPGKPLTSVPYLFLHRTFHEYLVARHLAQQTDVTWQKYVSDYKWFDPDWEVVIVLLAGCLSEPDVLLRFLLSEAYDPFHTMLFLAGQCLVESSRSRVRPDIFDDIVKRLMHIISSPTHEISKRAAQILWQLGKPVADELLKKLRDSTESDSVRLVLADSIQEYEGSSVVATLVRLLNDRGLSRKLLLAVLRAAERIRHPALHETLRDIMIDTTQDAFVRRQAIKALAATADVSLVNDFLPLLWDDARVVRLVAASSLGQIGEPGREVLMQALKYRDSTVDNYCAAIFGLEKSPDLSIVSELLKLTDEARYRYENNAFFDIETYSKSAIVALGKPAVRLLLAVFDAQSRWGPGAEILAADALSEFSEPQSVDTLITYLQSDRQFPDTSWVAARTLGLIGDQRALDPLLKILSDSHLDSWDQFQETRSAAALALGRLHDNRAVPYLLDALNEDVFELREAAVRALGLIGATESLDPLLDLIETNYEDEELRTAAITALEDIRDKAAIDALLGIATDKFQLPGLREAAVGALGRILARTKQEEVLTTLLGLLQLGPLGVRERAAYELSTVNDIRIAGVLLDLICNPGEGKQIRKAAFQGLSVLARHCNNGELYDCVLERAEGGQFQSQDRPMIANLLGLLAIGSANDGQTKWESRRAMTCALFANVL